jgi:pimeloyl-ACP methyl ester carboxylesterase
VGTQGTALQSRLGSEWDILSWDPRGVGASEPDLTLFDTADEYDTFYNQLQGVGKYEAHGNTTQNSDAYFL